MSALSALLGKSAKPVAPVVAAPVAPFAPATLAAPVRVEAPPGAPELLGDLMAEFQANLGKLPQVNPPEAVKTLAGLTMSEIAGNPEPAEVAEIVIPPTSKPAAVLAAEQASKRKNRTAAVVQAELDAALKEIERLEKLGEPAAIVHADLVILQDRYEMVVSDLKKAHIRLGELETASGPAAVDELLQAMQWLTSVLPSNVTITIAGARK